MQNNKNIRITKEYPTKEEILEKEIMFPNGITNLIKGWKTLKFNEKWENKENHEKILDLIDLTMQIAELEGKEIKIDPSAGCYMYRQPNKSTNNKGILYMNHKRPSIISTLHEIGHMLLGTDELKACRWSVWLFKKNFKKEYENLKFQGHILIKKNERIK